MKDEEGATAIEYGLIVGLISLAIITAAGVLGGDIAGAFTKISTKLKAAIT
ncbi:MAG: Flp family type IVb pilin [Pseudomonadota bacterium]